jgi:hypothetical protein
MSLSTSLGRRNFARRAASWLPAIPLWAALAFSAGFLLAMSPNLLRLYGIHNDYEMIINRSEGFFFAEAGHLASIGRPIAALISNLPMLPVRGFEDFRWTRLFSALTVCVLGMQLMSICVNHLRIRTRDAVAVSLVAFLVPPFIYSVLNATAWAPHLISIMIAFGAYTILARSDVQALPFIPLAARRDLGGLWRQARDYFLSRNVLLAGLVFQVGLYNFPPSAQFIVILPVVALLFSPSPMPYRLLRAARDLAFVIANLAFYALSAKLVYIPIIRLLVFRYSEAWRQVDHNAFENRIASSYDYAFNFDPGEMLVRLKHLTRVAGDLWFLPQANLHVVAAAIILLAIVVANLRRRGTPEEGGIARLKVESWTSAGLAAMVIIAACYLISASSVLGSSGGFVTYRTIPVSIAIAAIVALYAVRSLAAVATSMLAGPLRAAGVVADAAMMLTALAAIAGVFEINFLTMKLARNETAYFTEIVRQAIAEKAKSIVIVDPRPFTLPEDHPVAYDRHGSAIPPYELACLSGYCLQTGSIVQVFAAQLGVPLSELKVFSLRGDDPVPGLTCEMLTAARPSYPAGASDKAISTIKFLRSLPPVKCVAYDLAWRDLSINLER